MAVKIRLARHGKKGAPFYHIVAADSRAPRDGKFIEKLGTYNPNTNPATIDLKFDRALDWLQKGAQPTETCRRILSYKGVLLKKHLNRGVQKGALTQEQADAKFNAWVAEKEAKVASKKASLFPAAMPIRWPVKMETSSRKSGRGPQSFPSSRLSSSASSWCCSTWTTAS